jgi:peptide deformylase
MNLDDLKLIHFADPRMAVKPPAFDFEKDGDKAEDLAKAMHKKMVQLGGVGLSANQLGLSYRMFVIGNEEEYKALFNPTVIGVSKNEVVLDEGCISFPGFMLALRRPENVAVEFYDEKGEKHTGTFMGVSARIVLHEYDHMEGLNFTHHASNFKLRWELNKIKKKQKKMIRKMKNVRR